MVIMQRKIQCKYTGPDKYMQEGFRRDKWLPVVATEVRKREKAYEGKKRVIEEIFYIIIGDNGQLITTASFNCETRIDESAEIPGGQLIGLLNNLLTMVKVWSEKFSGDTGGRNSKKS
jgi:hypothetical protein